MHGRSIQGEPANIINLGQPPETHECCCTKKPGSCPQSSTKQNKGIGPPAVINQPCTKRLQRTRPLMACAFAGSNWPTSTNMRSNTPSGKCNLKPLLRGPRCSSWHAARACPLGPFRRLDALRLLPAGRLHARHRLHGLSHRSATPSSQLRPTLVTSKENCPGLVSAEARLAYCTDLRWSSVPCRCLCTFLTLAVSWMCAVLCVGWLALTTVQLVW